MCAVAPACAAAVSAPATPSATPRAPDAPAAAADAASAELGSTSRSKSFLVDAARAPRGRRRRAGAFKVVLRRRQARLDAEGVIDDVEALVGQRLDLGRRRGHRPTARSRPAFERRLSDELLVAAAEAAAAAEAHEAATLEAQQTAKAISLRLPNSKRISQIASRTVRRRASPTSARSAEGG